MKNQIKQIISLYNRIKPEIEKKLKIFSKKGELLDKKEIFDELCFCILTPQSKAEICWGCIEKIRKNDLIEHDKYHDILNCLKSVRFYRTKAGRIIEAKKYIDELIDVLKSEKDPCEIRQWIVENIKGLGMKEATHFLRNIGKSGNLAILDRHILRKLQKLKIIKEVPASISKRKYIEIEKKMQNFAKKIKIPVSHLDFVFWYQETGRIFK